MASDADRLHGSQMVDQADCKCHIAASWGVAARAPVAVASQAWEVPVIEAVDRRSCVVLPWPRET